VEENTMARYYLAGNYFAAPEQAEFLLTDDPREAATSLTPGNHEVFLLRYSPPARPLPESAPSSP